MEEVAEGNQDVISTATLMEHARTRDLSADRRRQDTKTQPPSTTSRGDRPRIAPADIQGQN